MTDFQTGQVELRRRGLAAASVAAAVLLAGAASSEDWPTYRHDIARSGVTTERLDLPLSQCWVFQPRYGPEPAWSDPNPRPVGGHYKLVEYRRVHFDDAFHVAVAGGQVFFGSSADNKVYALDVATGKPRWITFTDGPVRLAPTVWKDRVFVGSDDGFAYCLRARDGKVAWKFRVAPEERKLLGSGKMISSWPLRTSVLVDEGVAYVGAGIFPSEGVCISALQAENGHLIWRNDTCGDKPQSRISPQGYLLASNTALFAPMGRVSPAAFDRKSGNLLHQAYMGHWIGGTYALLADDYLFTGTKELMAYRQNSPGSRLAWFQGRKLVVKGEGAEATYYLVTERDMSAVDRKVYSAASVQRWKLLGQKRKLDRDIRRAERDCKKREAAAKTSAAAQAAFESATRELEKLNGELTALEEKLAQATGTVKSSLRWRVPCDCYDSMIMAGDVIFAGGSDKVVAVDAGTGETLWTGRVDGKARGLAAAEGRLFVSTDTGAIHCFGPQGSRQTGPVAQPTKRSPYARDRLTPVFEAAAGHIVRTTGIKRGYCLVLGCGTGRLAYELAKRTDLMIYGVDPDPRNVKAARTALDAAGLYGKRVCVEKCPLSAVPYSDYFANLIVSETALISGELPGDAGEMFRMLKPVGGVALIGQPAQAARKVKRLTRRTLRRWVSAVGVEDGRTVRTKGLWARIERGPLKGAGKWTHQYAEPGNTACGDDRIVKCPLSVLWFGEPGPGKLVERHLQSPAPLSLDGRFFGQGENVLMAYDAYNGVKLWERDITGARRTGTGSRCGNLALNRDGLFAAIGDKCLRLDLATGETKATYSLPREAAEKSRKWGYVATVGDLLFGSSTRDNRSSDCIFALDLRTGKHRWVHQGSSISHITIAIGEGRVFFADTAVTAEGRQEALKAKRERLKQLDGEAREEARKRLEAADKHLDIRLVTALDAATGRPRWQRCIELTDCRRISRGGGELTCMYSDGVLVFCAASRNGHFWEEFFGGDFAQRTIVALSARDGRLMWSKAVGYRHRALIVGDTLFAEPWALDLRTGRLKMRKSPLTGEESPWQLARPGHHCGPMSACPTTLFFRSYTIAYYDLTGDYGTQHFGSIRPGCSVNMIPANGLVLVPEASSGCMCPFPNQCTVVFQPGKQNKAWAMYSAFKPGKEHKSWAMHNMARSVKQPSVSVRHLALNLGAPGDRKGADGTLWLGYPRPYRGRLVFKYNMKTHILSGGGYYKQNPLSVRIAGTGEPWVYASGCRGLARCVLPLVGEKQKPGIYTVRLGFVEPDNDRSGQRVFDIKLQGSSVLEDFDIFEAAGGRDRTVVREFEGIRVNRDLTVELAAKGDDLSRTHAPILNSIEVIRTKAFSFGMLPPSFLLSDVMPEQTREVTVTSYSDRRFVGRLRAGSVPGIRLRPMSISVRLEPGEEKTYTLKAIAARGTKAGEYRIPLKLVGAGGRAESESFAIADCLGDRGEVVLTAVEDATVAKSRPAKNYASDQDLWVDGGDKEMGDRHHRLVYFKFRLEVPGRPKSARLRLHVSPAKHTDSGDSGVIRLVEGKWAEDTITYEGQPELGEQLAKLGRVTRGGVVERALTLSLEGRNEVSFVIEPTTTDGAGYCSRETSKPAELIVEFGP